jgi:hypothetical protein
VSKVQFEILEQRIMLSTGNPIPPPPLPSQPTPLQGVVGTPNSLDPALINGAFDFNALSYDISGTIFPADGAGETIAIVDAFGSPTIINDVQAFDAETFTTPGESVGKPGYGISNYDAEGNFFLTVQKLNPTGAELPASIDTPSDIADWSKETSLDVEWAHAVAPGAHILLVEAPSDSLTDLLDANVFAAQQPGVVAVSNSWGIEISSLENPDGNPYDVPPFVPANLPATLDGYLVTPTGHIDNDGLTGGVVFMASSGDTYGQDDFPAASANVLSVGGETDTIDLNDVLENIGPWDNPSPIPGQPNDGSGGGQSTTTRTYTNPIVALDADPTTGVWVYDSTPVPDFGPTIQGGWSVVGGTSFSCPAWAGVIAIIDQGLNLRGFGSMNNEQVLGEEPYDDRGTTAPGDTGPTIQTNNATTPATVTVLGDPASGYGILGLAENDLATNDDFTQFPTGDDGGGMESNFPLWGHMTNSVTAGTITTTTTTPTPGTPVPDVAVTPSGADSFTGWGLPDNDSGNIGLDDAENPDFSARGGFIQDMVGGAVGLTIFSDTLDYFGVTQQPNNSTAGTAIPTFTITAFSPTTLGVDTSFNGPVTLQLLGAGTLVGTTTVDAFNGSATFSSLSITKTGVYEIEATSPNVVPVDTLAFNVFPAAATHIVILSQPASFWQDSVMTSSIVVLLEDQFGDVVSGSGANVSLSINSGPLGGVLIGKTTVATVQGAATFSGISANLPGTYTLTVSSSPFQSLVTGPFAVVPIPVTQRYTLNGASLSFGSIELQQSRNAKVVTKSPPTAGEVDQVLADNNQPLSDAAVVAAPSIAPAGTFAAVGNTASNDSGLDSQLLDTTSSSNDKVLLN